MRKRNNYKNIFGVGIAVSVFALAAVGNADAQECAALPTCEEFGYLYTAEECAGQKYVKCPFDQTKYFCPDEPVSDNCKIGDILYSDKSCSSVLVSGKIPIAVVFNEDKQLAIALEMKQKHWSYEKGTGEVYDGYFDIPGVTNYNSKDSAKTDWAGKSNTNIAMNYCKSNGENCPAFEYVSTYTTTGTSAGDWYLPAMGELNNIYENRSILNKTLSLLGGQQLSENDQYWSSSEMGLTPAWLLGHGNIGWATKNASIYVRPVLEF